MLDPHAVGGCHGSFDPDCPGCQERLHGSIPAGAGLRGRLPVLLASAAIVTGPAAPAASIAAEPDQQQEGTASPDDVPPGDRSADPDFDPGGPDDVLDVDAGPPVVGGDAQDDGAGPPIEAEPVVDPDVEIPDTPAEDGRSVVEPPTSVAPAPDVMAPAPTPAAPAPATSPPATETPDPAAPAPPQADERSDGDRMSSEERRRSGPDRPNHHAESMGVGTPSAPSQPTLVSTSTPEAVPAESAPPSALVESRASVGASGILRSTRDFIDRSSRNYTVRPGDGFELIALDRLGAASAVEVALEARRLWVRNKDRIGSDDPNFLPATDANGDPVVLSLR